MCSSLLLDVGDLIADKIGHRKAIIELFAFAVKNPPREGRRVYITGIFGGCVRSLVCMKSHAS